MAKIKCPNCGNVVEEGKLFCDACGESISKEHHSRMVGKAHNREKVKEKKTIDEFTISSYMRFIALYILTVLFLVFGIFMAVIGTEAWLVIVIFLASTICFGIASSLLIYYLKNKNR